MSCPPPTPILTDHRSINSYQLSSRWWLVSDWNIHKLNTKEKPSWMYFSTHVLNTQMYSFGNEKATPRTQRCTFHLNLIYFPYLGQRKMLKHVNCRGSHGGWGEERERERKKRWRETVIGSFWEVRGQTYDNLKHLHPPLNQAFKWKRKSISITIKQKILRNKKHKRPSPLQLIKVKQKRIKPIC